MNLRQTMGKTSGGPPEMEKGMNKEVAQGANRPRTLRMVASLNEIVEEQTEVGHIYSKSRCPDVPISRFSQRE